MDAIEVTAADRKAMVSYEDARPVGLEASFREAILRGEHDGIDRVQAFAAHRTTSSAGLVEAAQALLDGKTRTYTARNGREVGIEADDGEACDIVHSDLTFGLERALAAHKVADRG